MGYKNLVLVALCAIITLVLAGCGGGGDGAPPADGTPNTATVRVALNTPVNNLGVLVFDITPGPGATVRTAAGINEAAPANVTYAGFINPADPSNRFTVLDAEGINITQNSDFFEVTYDITPGSTPLPTFQVTGDVTANTPAPAGANIPLTADNFVVTTQFN